MAKEKGKKERKVSQSPEEMKAEAALAKFVKDHEGKTLTEAQKAEKKELAETLGKLKFVRIANKRIPRTLKAIEGIAQLGAKQYVKSEAQVTATVKALKEAVSRVESALSGRKEAQQGFQLPGFDEQE